VAAPARSSRSSTQCHGYPSSLSQAVARRTDTFSTGFLRFGPDFCHRRAPSAPPRYDGHVSELRMIRAGLVPYEQAWDRQRQIHADVVAGEAPDTVLLLEHPPVYTAGKRTAISESPFDGTPVVDVDRGGKITWHGPGQLVGYPIVRLPDRIDMVAYVRRMERMLISVCHQLGVRSARQVEGRSCVWLPADDRDPERKIAAIGIRVRPRRHAARLRAQLRRGPHLVRSHCSVRDQRRGRHLLNEGTLPRRASRRGPPGRRASPTGAVQRRHGQRIGTLGQTPEAPRPACSPTRLTGLSNLGGLE
jgi:lipoate-protein ligase B